MCVNEKTSFCSCHWNTGLFFVTCPPLLFFSSSFCPLRASLALQTTFWKEKKTDTSFYNAFVCVFLWVIALRVSVCVCVALWVIAVCVCVCVGGWYSNRCRLERRIHSERVMEEEEEKENVIKTCQKRKRDRLQVFHWKLGMATFLSFPPWSRKTSCYDFTEPSGNKQLNDINVLDCNWLWFDWHC